MPTDTSAPEPATPPQGGLRPSRQENESGPDEMANAPAGPQTGAVAGAIRASDAERERVVAVLHRALGEGRIDLEENEARVTAVYATRFRDQLPAVLADLPDEDSRPIVVSRRGPSAPAWDELWAGVIWRLRTVVFGPDTPRPTGRQQGWAAVWAVVALVWTVLCALLAAAMMAL